MKRKYKSNQDGSLKRWWYVVRGERSYVEQLKQEWENIATLTGWKLQTVFGFDASEEGSCTYRDLLDLSELPTLQLRRTFLKLCYLYKIMNGFFIYPNTPLVSRQIRPLRNSSCHLLERLPSRTNAYMHSYFPHTISLWNNLPSSLHNCSSLVSFKRHLLTHLMS